jgi:hypothetical protein
VFCSARCQTRRRSREHYHGPRHDIRLARALHQRHTERAGGTTDLTAEELIAIREEATNCALCDCLLGPTNNKRVGELVRPNARSIDHVAQIGNGGRHVRANIRIVCEACNRARPLDAVA